MSFNRLAVTTMAAALAIGLLALVAALRASPSQAQQGTMNDCPLPGKWSVAVWTGDNGTDAGQAFSSCGEGNIEAAYSLDQETQVWSRWFANKPELSNLSALNDMQGVLALAPIDAVPIIGLPNPASVYCVDLGYELTIVDEPGGQVGMCVFPDGTQCEEWSFFRGECGQSWAVETGVMYNCPEASKWSITVWDGAGESDVSQALSFCEDIAIEAAYYLDPESQVWSRWFAGEPEISNLSTLGNLQGLMALGAAAPAATPTPTPTATSTTTPTATTTSTPAATATPTPTPTATPYFTPTPHSGG